MNLQFKLTKELAFKLLPEAISLSKSIMVDELDCSKSVLRQPTIKTIEEVIQIINSQKYCHSTFIFRPGRFEINGGDGYFELVISTFCQQPEYFLWIQLDFTDGWELAQKYKLERF